MRIVNMLQRHLRSYWDLWRNRKCMLLEYMGITMIKHILFIAKSLIDMGD